MNKYQTYCDILFGRIGHRMLDWYGWGFGKRLLVVINHQWDLKNLVRRLRGDPFREI